MLLFIRCVEFQYTHPRRERHFLSCGYRLLHGTISIHTPTKGATVTYGKSGEDSTIFQSTLPRRERPYTCDICHTTKSISIHTPTKGATKEQGLRILKILFQSTLPRRERLELDAEEIDRIYISIHTPTKGATYISR